MKELILSRTLVQWTICIFGRHYRDVICKFYQYREFLVIFGCSQQIIVLYGHKAHFSKRRSAIYYPHRGQSHFVQKFAASLVLFRRDVGRYSEMTLTWLKKAVVMERGGGGGGENEFILKKNN